MVLSADGTRIVSGSYDKTVRVWDAQSGECVKTLEGHTDVVAVLVHSTVASLEAEGVPARNIAIGTSELNLRLNCELRIPSRFKCCVTCTAV